MLTRRAMMSSDGENVHVNSIWILIVWFCLVLV